jgi:hypothetical protein
METSMTDDKRNEASLRANDPVDRLDLPEEEAGTAAPAPEQALSSAPSNMRSEGAEMAPEIDDVDGEKA